MPKSMDLPSLIKVHQVACDQCGIMVDYPELRHVMVPRPSERDTLVCIMWGCKKCWPDGQTAKELQDYFDAGDESDGRSKASKDGYLFYII